MSRKKYTRWLIVVSSTLDELLEKAIENDTHVTKSDFIREAVREKLEKMGLSFRLKPEEVEEAKG